MQATDELVEKVARAICRADGKDPDAFHTITVCDGEDFTTENWKFHYQFLATKAIEAIR